MKKKAKILILLHIMLMVYSVESILSKTAAFEDFLSVKWCLLYGGVLLLLAFYAIGWQQIIKHMPLTSAYANKAVTTVWGLIWGVLFFQEKITLRKILGIILIVVGVVIFSLSDNHDEKNESNVDNCTSEEVAK